MTCTPRLLASFLLLLSAAGAFGQLASTPPMGWNSWDSYGTTVTEEAVKVNADWMSTHLREHGWQYVVVDMEWFVSHPKAPGSDPKAQMHIDTSGRYVPDPERFPSANPDKGFAPLAAYVHARGLKLGIHILQGIPKQAIQQNLPIAGTAFHAADAANTNGTCAWNPDNYDLQENAAGQAYYDSIAKLYAGWGVDLIKVDCIASRPYKGAEIRMLSEALRKTGRPIVLSLSPGPAPIDKVAEMRQYAQMWRISNDVWDEWHSNVEYPQGLGDQFPRAAAWAPLAQTGHWPDADMLPLGYLGPAPGWGEARSTRLTPAEQQSFLTLWCIFRSPLMMGGDLPHSDAATTALLTNDEVLAVDRQSRDAHQQIETPAARVWVSRPEQGTGAYVAVFNVSEQPQTLHYDWAQLGMQPGAYGVRDLWMHRYNPPARALDVQLAPHASMLYRVTPTGGR